MLRIQRLDLLESLFGEGLIPQEVANEFAAAEALVRRRDLDAAPWLKVTPIGERRREDVANLVCVCT